MSFKGHFAICFIVYIYASINLSPKNIYIYFICPNDEASLYYTIYKPECYMRVAGSYN